MPESMLAENGSLHSHFKQEPIRKDENNELALVCAYNEFDPFIKFGRDNLLFVKREALDL